jgi:hypothetical protein
LASTLRVIAAAASLAAGSLATFVSTWKPLSIASPSQPRVAPRVASASIPGQPSRAGTRMSLGAGLPPMPLRVTDALCASIRSRASAGWRTSVGPLAISRTTTSSPGRAVARTGSPPPRSVPTRTAALAVPRVAAGVGCDCPGTMKVISSLLPLAMGAPGRLRRAGVAAIAPAALVRC